LLLASIQLGSFRNCFVSYPAQFIENKQYFFIWNIFGKNAKEEEKFLCLEFKVAKISRLKKNLAILQQAENTIFNCKI